MIVLVDTSSAVCVLVLVIDGKQYEYEWQADRRLAKELLAFLRDRLSEHAATVHNITGIGVMRGPGSFTGLRIGMTVLNTLAESVSVPIVGVTGDDWRQVALQRLDSGENDRLVLPEYGADAHITKPRK